MKLFREVGYLRDLNRESERGCHLLKAFNLIDDYNTGGLSEAQIRNFLNKNIEDACFKKKDVRAIFRRLKLPYRTISYVDLLNSLFPVVPKVNKNEEFEQVKLQIISKLDL